MKEIVSGVKVSLGVVRSTARVIKDVSDLEKMKAGDILVIPKSDPVYALYVMRASGVICQYGGKLSHLCIVSLEMGIPCLTSVEGACELIKDGDDIILDANEGKVYSCD